MTNKHKKYTTDRIFQKFKEIANASKYQTFEHANTDHNKLNKQNPTDIKLKKPSRISGNNNINKQESDPDWNQQEIKPVTHQAQKRLQILWKSNKWMN